MPRVAPRRLTRGEAFRYRLTALALRLGIFLCRFIPRDFAVRLGARAGETWFRHDEDGKRRALKNVKRAFGKRNEKPGGLGKPARERIVLGMYRHWGMVAAESMVLLGRNDMHPYSRWLTIENSELAREVLKDHGSAVFVTCHGGHFELLGAAMSEQAGTLHAVMKAVENPYLNQIMVELREKLGMQLIQKFPALREIVRRIREGGCVAMLVDQRRRNRALIVDFFGREAATVDTPAVLAYRYDIPIIPAFSYRTGGPFEYEAYVDDLIFPDRSAPLDDEVVRMTQAVNDSIERFVRAHPEQWNWIQPRWKISDRIRRRARKRGPTGRARSEATPG